MENSKKVIPCETDKSEKIRKLLSEVVFHQKRQSTEIDDREEIIIPTYIKPLMKK